MLFNSIPFLIFLPAVFAVYWGLPRRGQNLFLVAASYLFYGWWDWRFLGLIVLSSLVDYLAGSRIARRRAPRGWLAASLVANLGTLALFKYLDFGIEAMAALLARLGFQPHLQTLGIVLPVGISFYTLQTLSYTIDIYRRRAEPVRDPVAFFAFVAFFPQLVAGPIERARNLLPQFLAERSFDRRAATDALLQMAYGLWLKAVVADNLGLVADWSWDQRQVTGWTVLIGAYAFAFQIYGDFAGYSHIAIGTARLFGFRLMRNFAYPYFASSPAEFWRRWHISLSSWFRDYVYIPLGGSRRGPVRRRVNLILTFVLSGLWHGAGLQFVAWGLYHGLLVGLQWWRTPFREEQPLGPGGRSPRALLGALATFHLVGLGWVLFRSESLSEGLRLLAALAGPWPGGPPWNPWLVTAALTVALEWVQRRQPHGLAFPAAGDGARLLLFALVAALVVLLGRVDTVPFIYFQF